MMLFALACATTRVATVVGMTPGAGPGEVYVLAEIREVQSAGARNELTLSSDRVLLRCQEESFEAGYATTCHPFLTDLEAARAALSMGDSMATHSRKPRPPPVQAQERDEDDE